MKIISWNVNGLRAVLRKNLLPFLATEQPDIFCVQETKARAEDVEPLWPGDYEVHWNSAERRGYSGTATFTRHRPLAVSRGIGVKVHDREGRVLTTDHGEFFLVNVYVPNAQRELTRLPYRQNWDRAFLRYLRALEASKPVVVCGDFNCAHTEIDLTHPKPNVKNHGFTPQERAGFGRYLAAGWLDAFREFESGGGHYTWWSVLNGARARNVGWRIDYFLVSRQLRPRLQRAWLLPHVEGSDHCPVAIELA